MVNVLDVTQISDVIDAQTRRPFTADKWAQWVWQYHQDHLGTTPSEDEVQSRVEQMMAVVEQIPEHILEDMSETTQHTPRNGELVGLIREDAQDTMEGVTYAIYEKDKELKDIGMRGNWFHIMLIDAVGIAHHTDERWPTRATYADGYEAYKIVEWPERKGAEQEEGRGPHTRSGTRPRKKESTPRGEGRVKGPVQSTFPRPTGWKVDGQPVNLGLLSVKDLTKVLTNRQFKPSTAEAGWQERVGTDLKVNFKRAWRVSAAQPFYCVSRPRLRRQVHVLRGARKPAAPSRVCAYTVPLLGSTN